MSRRGQKITQAAQKMKEPVSRRRNRLYMVVVLIIILAIVGWLFAAFQHVAHQRKMEHKHTFFEYVTVHKLGTLVELDDGIGLTPISYVLILNHALPDKVETQFATTMMKEYAILDHGQILSIQYKDAAGRQHPIADCNYDDDRKIFALTVTRQNGSTYRLTKHVDW